MPRKNRTLPHTPFRFTTNCQKKRRFSSEREAKEAADYQMALKPELELTTYKCELCGGWHLTNAGKK